MPAATTSYAEVTDLRKGDIPLPSYMGDGSQFIDAAAEEIDAQLGHIYVTPMVIEETPANRPSILLLKKINWLIASGRLILDLASAGEQAGLHAYGKRMLDEGLLLLSQVASKEIVLSGAEPLPPADPDAEQGNFTGPAIFNEDSESLVQSFYERHDPYNPSTRLTPPAPYGNVRL